MNILDLKEALLNNTLDDNLIIFVCPENTFLAESYINEICEQKNLAKKYIEKLSETTDSALSLVFDYTEDLNIVKTDTFNELADDYAVFKHCVVVCKKIDKVILAKVNDYVVEMPKLVDWQIKAFIAASCPGLAPTDIDWLYEATSANIFQINNILEKIKLVDEAEQSKALYQVCFDLFSPRQVFDLVEALVKGDKTTAFEFLKHANDYTNLDPIGLTTLTLTKFRNILLVTYNSGIKEELLNLSKGALWHIKTDNKNTPLARIMKAIEFLSAIDTRLKENPSNLDFVGCKKSAMLEYIVLGTLACNN